MKKDYSSYALTDEQNRRIEKLKNEYLQMHDAPKDCIPKFIMPLDNPFKPTWEERLADKDTMFRFHLEKHSLHLQAQDDAIPYARVDFGTCVVANAFGCDVFYPKNNLPCAKNHVAKSYDDVLNLQKPDLQCLPYKKVYEWTEYFYRNLPQGFNMCMADIQGPFNNAHLVRGNDIFLDIYDNEDIFHTLMRTVTQAVIEYAKEQRKWMHVENNVQYDWWAVWRGNARISNCSLHMIGQQLYVDHVQRYDEQFIDDMQGGRIHYCGTTQDIVETIGKIPGLTGIDYDSSYYDIEEAFDSVPEHVVLMQTVDISSEMFQRILNSKKWPWKKRNIIFNISGPSMRIREAADLYNKLRYIAES